MGDWVYVKLWPYVRMSLAPRANQKLAFKFFGPYRVVAKIGSVAEAACFFLDASSVSCVSVEESRRSFPAGVSGIA